MGTLIAVPTIIGLMIVYLIQQDNEHYHQPPNEEVSEWEVEDRIFSTDNYGEVSVRNVMFDIDGTNLEEGIEIKGDDIELTEIMGYYDVDDLDIEEVEELLEKNE